MFARLLRVEPAMPMSAPPKRRSMPTVSWASLKDYHLASATESWQNKTYPRIVGTALLPSKSHSDELLGHSQVRLVVKCFFDFGGVESVRDKLVLPQEFRERNFLVK